MWEPEIYSRDRELLRMAEEARRLKAIIAQWEAVGDAIMECVTGKPAPLSDSDVIGEVNALRHKVDELSARLEQRGEA